METTRSADGTTIAFERTGEGPAVVIVGGAFSVAADGRALAEALADAGFTAVTIDPLSCTSPVPTRFRIPSASVMMREIRTPLCVESK